MPGICTNVVRDSGGTCEHLTLTADLDGETIEIHSGLNDPAWQDALTLDEKKTLLLLLARWWKGKGENIADFIGRTLAGEEATNVKIYHLLMKDVTKTNIGTNYVDVPPGANGERMLVDFMGCTQFRVIVNAVLAQTGAYQMRIVRDSDSAVLYESASINAAAGDREFDTGWQGLPADANGQILVRFQAKSATGADDPVFRRCIMGVK